MRGAAMAAEGRKEGAEGSKGGVEVGRDVKTLKGGLALGGWVAQAAPGSASPTFQLSALDYHGQGVPETLFLGLPFPPWDANRAAGRQAVGFWAAGAQHPPPLKRRHLSQCSAILGSSPLQSDFAPRCASSLIPTGRGSERGVTACHVVPPSRVSRASARVWLKQLLWLLALPWLSPLLLVVQSPQGLQGRGVPLPVAFRRLEHCSSSPVHAASSTQVSAMRVEAYVTPYSAATSVRRGSAQCRKASQVSSFFSLAHSRGPKSKSTSGHLQRKGGKGDGDRDKARIGPDTCCRDQSSHFRLLVHLPACRPVPWGKCQPGEGADRRWQIG